MLMTKEGTPVTDQLFVDSGEEFIMPTDVKECADLLYWADAAFYWTAASINPHSSDLADDVVSRSESLQDALNHVGKIVVRAMREHGLRLATMKEVRDVE